MNKPWDIYEQFDGLALVVRMDTYEVLWMNQATQALFGCDRASYRVRPCYELIHNKREQCTFCNYSRLSEGKSEQSELYLEVLLRHYLLLDTGLTVDGAPCKLQIGFDISKYKDGAVDADLLHHYERSLNDGIKESAAMENPHAAIDLFLSYVGRILNGDRAYIFERDERQYDSNTYEWCAGGITPEIDNLQGLPPEVCAQWYTRFAQNGVTIIPDVEAYKLIDPIMYDTLAPQGIRSLVVVPIYEKGEAIGFYGIDNPPVENLYITRDILEIASGYIVSLLSRRKLYNQLIQQSYTDALTGAKNRFALYELERRLPTKTSIGCAYADVTGLKEVNDTRGHAAGDELIRTVHAVICDAFSMGEVYRIGGDEFLIIVHDMDSTAFDERILALRQLAQTRGVNIAVGANWVPCLQDDLSVLTSLAEQRMYEDKSAWYRANNRERRRR